MDIPVHAGTVLCSDQFYRDFPEEVMGNLMRYGALCAEMESAALYMTARKLGKRALAMFTISDHILTQEADSPEARQEGYRQMMELALEIAPA